MPSFDIRTADLRDGGLRDEVVAFAGPVTLTELRTADRSVIAKARFQDYERARRRRSSGR
ncbi:hypothetical protein [Micromonospora sp. RTP1Z1]|uniref:hypothetical protein n=1 Tax=Micromonospora sp. RTP1Z1 TaxID=2994043 RepID=UPI0029C96F62|nr:hypothetical protein [Micromonospora sp. RTP1Z1]